MLKRIAPSKGLRQQLDGQGTVKPALDAGVDKIELGQLALRFPHRPRKAWEHKPEQGVFQNFEVVCHGRRIHADLLGDCGLIDDFPVHLRCNREKLPEWR